MLVNEFHVPKRTQTYADVLVAVGLAKLLSLWPQTNSIQLRDRGAHYQLLLSKPLDWKQARQAPLGPVYPYILFKPTDPKPKAASELIDYSHERQIEEAYRKYVEATRNRESKQAAQVAETAPPTPREDLQLFKDFNSLRMGSPAYSKLYLALEEIPEELPLLVLNRLSDLLPSGVTVEWTKVPKPNLPASSLQLFSPITGKGVHRPKADGAGVGQFSKKLIDWFEEWMKYIAMHVILSSHRAGDNTIVLAIAPEDISLDGLATVRRELLRKGLWGNLKVEINATLSIAQSLIANSEFANRGVIRLRGRRPNQLVRGIYISYFKSLGTGKALMNNAFLGIPGWFPIETQEDADAWLAILDEHSRLIRGLAENKSDHLPLLVAYRDFISGGRLKDLLDFLVSYGIMTMSHLEDRRWVRHTTKSLRRLLMSYQLRSVIDNSGFQNIAAAIRRSTVSAQYRKAISGKQVFEIKYGLAQEWKQKMRFKDKFVAALADFVQQYNNENARHVEQDKETRPRITTRDLDQVIDLIEQYGSELVGMLLLAYGYAKESKEEEE